MPRIQALQQISPPSSPEVSAHGKHSLDTVSPIDSDSDASFDDFPVTAQRDPIPSQQRNPSSSLPVATRESLRPSQATTAAAKKPLQVPLRKQKTDPVRPSTQPVFTVIPNNPGPVSRNAGATSPSLGQRFKRLGKEAAHAFENRPPWKGASGREPQLKTLRDDLSVAPLNIPARSSRRAVSREGYSKPRPASLLITQPADNKTGKSGPTVRKLVPSKGVEKDARPQPKITIPTRRASQHYPSPPPSDPIAHTAGIDTTLSQPDSPTPASNPIRRKPSPATPTSKPIPHANPLASSPVYIPLAARGRSQSALGLVTDTSIIEEDEEEPKSHFSFTTSDESHTNADAEGDEADMSVIDPAPIGTPVMNRKRPLARGEYFHSSQSPALIGGAKRLPRKSDPHLRATSVSDLFSPGSGCKPLPLAPPEVSATDRIQHLDAQLFGLANRQINIERGIKKMTELMPTDYILASAAVIRRREDEKKKIEALRAELSEIQREQHELGFQRHRAYKRLDKEAQYEPTSLWVRRVAS
ncbi:hypothetical protein VHEMI03932 [[Torrubiella] hemipterigena]|nr:hypothetical protein VHEMI03932 [[Torrubiella] hemipterigena]